MRPLRSSAWNSQLGSLRQQLIQGGDQRIDPRGSDLPHQRIVDSRVAVDKDIAEGDDPGQVWHSVSGGEIDPAELIEGFADDLELRSTADFSIGSCSYSWKLRLLTKSRVSPAAGRACHSSAGVSGCIEFPSALRHRGCEVRVLQGRGSNEVDGMSQEHFESFSEAEVGLEPSAGLVPDSTKKSTSLRDGSNRSVTADPKRTRRRTPYLRQSSPMAS